MSRRQPAVETLARLVDSSEFVRVLRSPSRARTPHFAVHHLPAQAGRAHGQTQASRNRLPKDELSTMTMPAGALAVDDSRPGDPLKHFGVVVPKRHARRAVTRSLLKRQVYAAGDRHAGVLDVGLWIVRLRAPFDRALFPSASSAALRVAARDELESLFDALGSLRAA